jgi:hypothetical protein
MIGPTLKPHMSMIVRKKNVPIINEETKIQSFTIIYGSLDVLI